MAKHQLGLPGAGVESLGALTAHVHWVYCADILLGEIEIPGTRSLIEKQRRMTDLINKGQWEDRLNKILAAKTQCGGIKRQETLIKEALDYAAAM